MLRTTFLSLIAVLSTGTAFAQTNNSAVQDAANSNSAVAYVYVSRPTHVDGFAASSSGKLTAVPGSSFANINLVHMSVTKKFLFGLDNDEEHIDSFSIASNGALRKVATINAQSYNSGNCGGVGSIGLDSTATTLYNLVNINCEDRIQSFKIESDGKLGYLGSADSGLPSDVIWLSRLGFEGTNKFAYQVGDGGEETGVNDPYIVRYKRESNGLLAFDGLIGGLPKPKNTKNHYLPAPFAADPSNHLAIALEEFDTDSYEIIPPNKFASFSVNSNGELETKSGYENMPSTKMDFLSQ